MASSKAPLNRLPSHSPGWLVWLEIQQEIGPDSERDSNGFRTNERAPREWAGRLVALRAAAGLKPDQCRIMRYWTPLMGRNVIHAMEIRTEVLERVVAVLGEGPVKRNTLLATRGRAAVSVPTLPNERLFEKRKPAQFRR